MLALCYICLVEAACSFFVLLFLGIGDGFINIFAEKQIPLAKLSTKAFGATVTETAMSTPVMP